MGQFRSVGKIKKRLLAVLFVYITYVTPVKLAEWCIILSMLFTCDIFPHFSVLFVFFNWLIFNFVQFKCFVFIFSINILNIYLFCELKSHNSKPAILTCLMDHNYSAVLPEMTTSVNNSRQRLSDKLEVYPPTRNL